MKKPEQIFKELYSNTFDVMGLEEVFLQVTKVVANEYAEQFISKNTWISVEDFLPERQQSVLFVVKDSVAEYYNGKVYGGVYTDPDFSTPGICFSASHWMPSPENPKL